MEAISAVAPSGFKLHLDFTHQAGHPPRGTDHIPELLDRLSEYSVVGCFEDAVGCPH